MKRKQWIAAFALLTGAFGLVGCNGAHMARHGMDVDAAVAVLHGTEGNQNVEGVVRFQEMGDGTVEVVAEVSGLKPNGEHAIHVHEYGDCTALDAASAGGHYAPRGHKHALPGETGMRHAGDFGNLKADANGTARFRLVVDNITVAGAESPVLGRAVIVHADADQGVAAQPSGGAGPRIACGVIGIANLE